MKIQMVDLVGQYHRMQEELTVAIQQVLANGTFINGPEVKAFADEFASYLDIPYVVPCGNGTDALQISLMALGLNAGDEVIVPAFTYAAAVEVVALLGMTPVVVDVNPDTFNIDVRKIEQAISPKTKAIIAVHLFGQCCDMEPLLDIAAGHNLFVIEDNAQSTGATYVFSDGTVKQAGTMGHIGTTSFFPTKPLACYGDGGALLTSDAFLVEQARMISQHGQQQKYYHKIIGCNSRLDTLQAAVLRVKLNYLDGFRESVQTIAERYDKGLFGVAGIDLPIKSSFSTHVYHQYTIKVTNGKRDDLKSYLSSKGIPSMIYYPLPVHLQEAFIQLVRIPEPLTIAPELCNSVLSVPIHTELTQSEQEYIIQSIKEYEK
jgi:dTDP-4-amino-4,6-dideoxygalactose transaminase